MASEDHVLCGWRVRSTLPLPELAPWNGSPAVPPDIVIAEGEVPEHLDAAKGVEDWLTVGTDGTVLICVPGVVRLLVADGRRITVQILTGAGPGWRLFLLGAAIGFLCHQRGVFPLHAASVTIGNRTVAFLGQTGAGKSTLALALVRRGHGLLSDDLTVLGRQNEDICVLPAFPRLKLWRDTLDALGEDAGGLERVREGLDKFDLRLTDGFDPAPRRLDAIIVLGPGAHPVLTRLPAQAAMPIVGEHIARPWVARLLGRQAALFDEAAAIVRRIPVARLARPLDFALLDETTRLVEAMVLP